MQLQPFRPHHVEACPAALTSSARISSTQSSGSRPAGTSSPAHRRSRRLSSPDLAVGWCTPSAYRRSPEPRRPPHPNRRPWVQGVFMTSPDEGPSGTLLQGQLLAVGIFDVLVVALRGRLTEKQLHCLNDVAPAHAVGQVS